MIPDLYSSFPSKILKWPFKVWPILFFPLLIYWPVYSKTHHEFPRILIINQGYPTNIRGLSVVNNLVIWVSGSGGCVGRSVDGGKTWEWNSLSGFENLDFRDIEGFDRLCAVTISAGDPAIVLRTVDGGRTWKRTYNNFTPGIFMDGMAFWNKGNGLAVGDPMDGFFQILRTTDGGKTWKLLPHQQSLIAQKGEACFAASGTNLCVIGQKKVWFATGGQISRVFYSPDRGNTWSSSWCPMISGKVSTGIFSISFKNSRQGIVVGGDYQDELNRSQNSVLTKNGGLTWEKPLIGPMGYRSCVIYRNPKQLLTTGPSGTDISEDGGQTWQNISPLGFNVIQKSKKGQSVFLAGAHGRIARLLP
ncbi:MAG: WD40/YVTN/BNR-like repeat-containing protein [Chitinophagaceae bacterium]